MSEIPLPQPDLTDKVVLITGAGDGIGKAVAKQAGQYGATVILLGKTTKKLESVYDELLELGAPEPAIYPLDMEGASPADYRDMHNSIEKAFGRLDSLLNNAGWLGASSPIELYDIELWHKVIQVNLNAPFMLTQACIPLLRESASPTIVFNTDSKQSAYWGAYSVAKAGLNAMMKILADELESSAAKVTAFNPEAVRTQFRTRAYPGEDPSALPLPEDVAKYFVALMSGEVNCSGEILSSKDFS